MPTGYEPNFIGVEIPLPGFNEKLAPDVLQKPESLNAFDPETGSWRQYIHYSVATNKSRRQPICVALNVNQRLIKTAERSGSWKIDDAIGDQYQLDNRYYRNNDWDRGHMARRSTAAWGETPEDARAASDDTMYYSNSCLQHMNFNRDEWKAVEDWVQNLREDTNDKIAIFSGPIYGSKNPQFIGLPKAEIPAAFFKIVCFLDRNNGGELSTRAFIYTQDAKTIGDNDGYSQEDRKMYQVSTTKVEEATGLAFPDQLKSSNPIEGNPIVIESPKVASSGDASVTATATTSAVSVSPTNSSPPSTGADDGPTKTTTIGTPVEIPKDASAVFIAAALINPKGRSESSQEWINIANYSPDTVDLEGWTIDDQSDHRKPIILSGFMVSGSSLRLGNLRDQDKYGGGSIVLTNGSGVLTLKNAWGETVSKVEWTKSQPDGQVTIFNAF